MSSAPDPAYVAQIEAWRANRAANLKAEDGWPSVVGLFWLSEGDNTVGSAPDDTVVLPEGKAPKNLGVIALRGSKLAFRPAPGVEVRIDGGPAREMEIRSDGGASDPTVFSLGPLTFYVIERDHRFAVRVKDSQSEARRRFHGIPYFPIDPSWRIEARFEAYDAATLDPGAERARPRRPGGLARAPSSSRTTARPSASTPSSRRGKPTTS